MQAENFVLICLYITCYKSALSISERITVSPPEVGTEKLATAPPPPAHPSKGIIAEHLDFEIFTIIGCYAE